MANDVRKGDHRFEVVIDEEVVGYAEYRDAAGVRSFEHTVVADRFQGRGLAGQLVRQALDATRSEGLEVDPVCSYVRRFIVDHDDYLDLVPADQRARHDLPIEA